jgi:AbrB family looped-hinge helix DNA binding protein
MREMDMSMVTVSSKYQVVILKQVRENVNIKPGTKLQMVEVNGIIQMALVIPILEMRGYFKGHEIEYTRDKKDRL